MIDNRPVAPILPLTSVRFLAAFYVVLHHLNLSSWHLDASTFLGRFLCSGHVAVGFFFSLSGFILALVYLGTDRPFIVRKFWLARFARVYPMLVVSLLVAVPPYLRGLYKVVPHAALRGTAITFLGAASLLQAWVARFRDINAPAWSVSAEAFFYLIFPVFALWIWRRRGLSAFALTILFWGLALMVPLYVVHRHPGLFYQQVATRGARLQYIIQLAPVFRMFEFLSGISLCTIHRSLAVRLSPVQRTRWAYCCFLTAALLFFSVIAFAEHIPILVLNNGILLPASLLLIYALANAQGSLETIFSKKWFVVLGESSYALYLLHGPIMPYVDHFFPLASLWNCVLYIAVLIPTSVSAYFWIERPARKKILALAAQRPRVLIEQEVVSPN
jgi:peptidoglycan/LPS O-acetylase OafA/YrhL